MPRKRGIVGTLFQIARVADDIQSLSSPKRAARRAKNRLLGRALGRAGFWRWLWK
jgi:hypothetical protein